MSSKQATERKQNYPWAFQNGESFFAFKDKEFIVLCIRLKIPCKEERTASCPDNTTEQLPVCICLNILDRCLPAQFIMQISWLAIFKSEHWLWLVSQASSVRGSIGSIGCGNPHAFPPSPPQPTPISRRRCPPPLPLVSPHDDPRFLVCGWRNLTLHSPALWLALSIRLVPIYYTRHVCTDRVLF